MKLYTIFSPSHKIMYDDFFLKTLPNEFELVSKEIPQECSTGEFYKEGWSKTCYRKVEFFIQACEENIGKNFIYSDVDIQFFGKIKDALLNELGDYDIACQNDTGPYYCSGFFICNANQRTLNMFNMMKKNYNKEDQTSLNEQIHLVKSKFLSRRFFTVAHSTNSVWNGQDFYVPNDILIHHANWTGGIDNKIRLLDLVGKKLKKNG
jgi:lipopolysaccharide biosynthesis glycosyltransferase